MWEADLDDFEQVLDEIEEHEEREILNRMNK